MIDNVGKNQGGKNMGIITKDRKYRKFLKKRNKQIIKRIKQQFKGVKDGVAFLEVYKDPNLVPLFTFYENFNKMEYNPYYVVFDKITGTLYCDYYRDEEAIITELHKHIPFNYSRAIVLKDVDQRNLKKVFMEFIDGFQVEDIELEEDLTTLSIYLPY